MGFDTNAIKFLLQVKKANTRLGKTLTLGRQSYQLDKNYLSEILAGSGLEKERIKVLMQADPVYVEPFLKEMGASEVDSLDASSYESANLIHDLNFPVSGSLKAQYDTVIDAGTLEHVFNFPVAIKNCMEMLKVNGHFISITITNNFSGHGFYQFSPELFFRIFSPENGFKMKKMLLAINEPGNYWYEIPDPKDIKRRVIFENARQSLLLVLAEKVAVKEIFRSTPQQSDYEHLAWQGNEQLHGNKRSSFQKMFSFIPNPWKNKIRHKLRVLDPKAWKVFLRDTGSGHTNDFKKLKNM
ncbi:MAG: hypothetical protein Q8941_15315 [Bacteroidota bacterium]|nr:hypothetical protein [Bacteroidota bacterium]